MPRASIDEIVIERIVTPLQTKVRPKLLHDKFTLDGEAYPLYLHPLQRTWRSERTVEIPIGLRAVERAKGSVLEVGAVLRQYMDGNATHTVVDKYEHGPGILNEDAETFSGGPYDLIVSLSTIEHIGLDERPRDPDKPRRTITNLVTLLAPGGRMLITVPNGYNRDLDDYLASDEHPFDHVSYLRRRDPMNRHWSQVPKSEVDGIMYGYRYVGGNAITVAMLTAKMEAA
jgi:SAM-dependent methyltransferase